MKPITKELAELRDITKRLQADMSWVKKIGYYLSGIITVQLIATLTGKL